MSGPEVTMMPSLVRGLGNRSRNTAELVRPGGTSLAGGETPRANIRTRASLVLCRETWVGTFGQLAGALVTVGDKLGASAGAVESSDNASADQF